MTQTSFVIPKRAITLASSALLALAGAATLSTAWSAHATPGDPHKVWVCKYVQTPHKNEVLKAGKNPIFVDWASLTGKSDAPHVGDTFSDAHDKSVVVQIGGSNPGKSACVTTTPPTTPPTKPPTTPPTTHPPKTTPPTSVTPTTPSGGGGEVTPGPGAPDTGGAGGTNPLNGIVGSGLLLAAGGLVTADVMRRRRQDDQV